MQVLLCENGFTDATMMPRCVGQSTTAPTLFCGTTVPRPESAATMPIRAIALGREESCLRTLRYNIFQVKDADAKAGLSKKPLLLVLLAVLVLMLARRSGTGGGAALTKVSSFKSGAFVT